MLLFRSLTNIFWWPPPIAYIRRQLTLFDAEKPTLFEGNPCKICLSQVLNQMRASSDLLWQQVFLHLLLLPFLRQSSLHLSNVSE